MTRRVTRWVSFGLVMLLVLGMSSMGMAKESVAEHEANVTTQEGIFVDRDAFANLVAELSRLTGLTEQEMEERILTAIGRHVDEAREPTAEEPVAEEPVAEEPAEEVAEEPAATQEDEKYAGLAGDLDALRHRLDVALEAGEISEKRYERAIAVLDALDAEREALAGYLETFWSKVEKMPESIESRLDTLLEEKKITEYQHEKLFDLLERGVSLMERIADASLRPLTGDQDMGDQS